MRKFFRYEQRGGRIYIDDYRFGDLDLQIDGSKQLIKSPLKLWPSGSEAMYSPLHTTLATWLRAGYAVDFPLIIGEEGPNRSEQILHRITNTRVIELYHLKSAFHAYVIEIGPFFDWSYRSGQ